MYGGVLCNNKAEVYAGALYAVGQTSIQIYDGLITKNTAGAGGGIYIREDAKLSFYNGVVYNNCICYLLKSKFHKEK